MCFSATASLSAAAILGALGAGAIIRCQEPRMLPYAALPALFSAQQLAEGLLWLALAHDMPSLAAAMSLVFNLSAHVLWPLYIPLTVLLLEPQPRRKTLLACLVLAGTALAAYYLLRMAIVPVSAVPSAGHIEYRMTRYFPRTGMALYVAVTAGALFASSWPRVRRFGLMVLAAFILTWWAYATWLVSVWCFFAALLSVVVLAQVPSLRLPEGVRMRNAA
ncbi:DUF6629 family protein [Pseudoduganella rivuli]|uniref:DUF6629 family protein n=1 Tax=Pseudoduganella rivuli TaxID=2666085 RepID=UPI0018A2021E|nr:DUF6629 family protein [Pseudoduganella rivuli]